MNLSPIGTAYKQSQSKSFDGIGTAAQDGIGSFMDLFGQVAEKQKAHVDNDVKKKFVDFMAAMQHRKALEPPKPTPVLNKQDMAPMGIALLLALLTKQKSQDIAQFGQGFMDARGQAAGRQDQFNQQTWQTQNENAQQDQRYEIERAKMGYDAALDERSRLDTFGRENRQRADARIGKEESTVQTLWNRYLQANSPDEKQFIGGELVKLGKITPEFVKNAVDEMRLRADQASYKPIVAGIMARAGDMTDPAARQRAYDEVFKLVQTGALDKNALSLVMGAETFGNQGKSLDNAFKTSRNKYADEKFAADLERVRGLNKLTEEQTSYIKIKREMYPNYLQALMGSMDARNLGAISTIQGRDFDNAAQEFEMMYGDQLKAQSDIIKNANDEITKLTAKEVEARAAWQENPQDPATTAALDAINNTRRALKKRIADAEKIIKDINVNAKLPKPVTFPGGLQFAPGGGIAIPPPTGPGTLPAATPDGTPAIKRTPAKASGNAPAKKKTTPAKGSRKLKSGVTYNGVG